MDKERILAKLDEIEQYLYEIYANMPQSYEEYRTNLLLKRAMERLLQITIEACIDACAILVKDMKLGLPSSDEDFIDKLKGKVLSDESVSNLKMMKKFRNILVHGYAKIDDYRVFKILKGNISDIEKFVDEMKDFLREHL